jgi:hypothetical protein
MGLELAQLQRWMLGVIVHAGSVEQALATPESAHVLPPESIGSVVRPSRTLSPAERLGVYHDMYPLRMSEALESDYPALAHFLGEQSFRELVRGYVDAFPSRSYTLNRLGDRLPEYVASAPGVPRPAFCHDLARLELAVTQVFDAQETPRLREAEVAAVPPEAWERARLEPVAAFRLLALRYNANAYLQSVRDDDHDHPRPRQKDCWLAVYRRDYAVYRLELGRAAHDLLADLAAGTRLGPAVARALAQGRRVPREEQLYRWFRQWVAEGLFRCVQVGD